MFSALLPEAFELEDESLQNDLLKELDDIEHHLGDLEVRKMLVRGTGQ